MPEHTKGELKGELKSIELIYALMKDNPKITIPLMIAKSGKSRTTIQKYIKKLKEEKIVERIGGKKEGYWKILK